MASCIRTPLLLLALAFGTAAAQVTCDAGWTPGGSKCYKTLTTGPLAHCRSACATAGGQLPCITSVAENAMVQHVANPTGATCGMGSQAGCVWLSLHQTITTAGAANHWSWDSTCSSSYLNWAQGEPNDWGGSGAGSGDENCAVMGFTGSSQWYDAPCSMTGACFCEKAPTGGAAPSTPRFEYHPGTGSWSAARATCVSRGGDLASIHSAAENAAAFALVPQGESAWIGLTDSAQEGTWVWVDGTPYDFTDFHAREPNNYNNEDCAGYLRDFRSAQWADGDCSATSQWWANTGFICRFGASAGHSARDVACLSAPLTSMNYMGFNNQECSSGANANPDGYCHCDDLSNNLAQCPNSYRRRGDGTYVRCQVSNGACVSMANEHITCTQFATAPPPPPGTTCSTAGRPILDAELTSSPQWTASIQADYEACWCVTPEIFTEACSMDLDHDPSNGFEITCSAAIQSAYCASNECRSFGAVYAMHYGWTGAQVAALYTQMGCHAPPPPPGNQGGATGCVESYCTSSGNDCCAPRQLSEQATCSNGYNPIRLGMGCFSYSEGQYTCCPNVDCNNVPADCTNTCLQWAYCMAAPDQNCQNAPQSCQSCVQYAQCISPPPPAPVPSSGCSTQWCSSPGGASGSNDCWAGSTNEPCSCSRGQARPTGQTTNYQGITYYQYTCCVGGSNVGEQCGDYRANTPGGASGTVPAGTHFEFVSNPGSWSAARSECIRRGGDLASLHNAAENAAAFALVPANTAAWIGLSDATTEGTWVWTDGTPYDYVNFHPGEPNQGTNENCAGLFQMTGVSFNGQWADGDCSQSDGWWRGAGAVCRMTAGSHPTNVPPPPPPNACPIGWMPQSGSTKCNKLVGTGNQTECQAMCAAALPGATAGLACVENQAELDFLATFAGAQRSCCQWPRSFSCCNWVGLYQDPAADVGHTGSPTEGWDRQRNPTCTSTFAHWSPGEPNQYPGRDDEDCAMLGAWGARTFNDIQCSNNYRCLCETDTSGAPPRVYSPFPSPPPPASPSPPPPPTPPPPYVASPNPTPPWPPHPPGYVAPPPSPSPGPPGQVQIDNGTSAGLVAPDKPIEGMNGGVVFLIVLLCLCAIAAPAGYYYYVKIYKKGLMRGSSSPSWITQTIATTPISLPPGGLTPGGINVEMPEPDTPYQQAPAYQAPSASPIALQVMAGALPVAEDQPTRSGTKNHAAIDRARNANAL